MKKSILALSALTVLSAPLVSADIPTAVAASATKFTVAHASKGQSAASVKVAAPKNVILFIGDGMGEASRNTIRLATVGKSGLLEMDNMPVTGLVSTSSGDGPFTIHGTEETFYIDWTTKGHNAVDVALTAMGPGSSQFTGNYPNTAIHDKLIKLLQLKK